jgi:hypothetical protein
MLGVVAGLAGEYFTGIGLSQQTADHPVVVLASFVILSIATYAPLIKWVPHLQCSSALRVGAAAHFITRVMQ